MAGNEGSVSGQTELLSGWSYVVHRPSEDPEPSSLPSTVDITAFSSGPSVQPAHSPQNDCCSNSDSESTSDSENSASDGSGSCSYSSSDTESSSSSQGSSSSSIPPQFSVTSSQTGGLRLTIATVRKSCSSPTEKDEQLDVAPSLPNTNSSSENNLIKHLTGPKLSSSDSDSECSDSDCTSNSETFVTSKGPDLKNNNKQPNSVSRMKCLRKTATKSGPNKQNEVKTETEKKKITRQKESKVSGKFNSRGRGRPSNRTNKMTSLPLVRDPSLNPLSSDSESSASESNTAMLASCSLQEIRQEDLAAILPDQQDCDAFGGFECETRTEKPEVDVDGSGSDMELPTQLVNAAIQRVTTESSSETDSQPGIYASTLLQQFVQQTQLLNNPQQISGNGTKNETCLNDSNTQKNNNSNVTEKSPKIGDNSKKDTVKRKRGRPRKNVLKQVPNAEYCGVPNVSPDSGIQNSPVHISSPEPTINDHDDNKNSVKTKPKKELMNHKQKIALTYNNLDRMLYANSDRILYPPRRKVGRPAGKIGIRKPGRPPKHRHIEEKQNLNRNKNIKKTNDNDIIQLTSNTLSLSLGKSDLKNKKLSTIKHMKVMHSKHYKKQKKHKIKILKTVTSQPMLQIDPDIDKLVLDFIKFCNLGTNKQQKENLPEMFRSVKRLSKKRKIESNDNRKKKKQCNVSQENKNKNTNNNNEQRLPLKKRHYHISVNETGISENSNKEQTPSVELVQNNRKNESSDIIGVHIDEAIEACITKYTENTRPQTENVLDLKKSQITTPKKRHRLETELKDSVAVSDVTKKLESTLSNAEIKSDGNYYEKSSILESVVTELKNKKNCCTNNNNINANNNNNKVETVAQMITRKKNRLEDLASNLVSKKTLSASDEKKKKIESDTPEVTTRQSVIKKVKPVENKLLDSIVDEKPTGIFLQTVDLELHIPATTIQTIPTPQNIQDTSTHNLRNKKQLDVDKSTQKKVVPLENQPVKKKTRKKTINRTGFPTLKKKKKKVVKTESKDNETNDIYERIPRIDEEPSTFVQRTQMCALSVVSLDKLQAKREDNIESNVPDVVSKWEVSSECDSLPLDECTFTSELESVKSEKSDRPLSRLDVKQEHRRDSSADSLCLSDKSNVKRKRDSSSDKTEKKLKKRVRDVSPASSIEPLPFDKKHRSDSVTSSSGDDSKRSKKVPRWRKKFLVAGLFSDYYKEDDESARAKRESSSKAKLTYNPSEHPYGLLPPPYHCGKYLRCRKVPFQLPHDLWWQHMHSQLPGRDLVPSWNYRKIRTNVYCVRAPSGACEPQACNCSASSGCEDDCINRLVLAECPSTHRCRNQRIQKHEWAPGLEKFMTENKGWGVRTKMSIKAGEFILEYVGEVVSDQEFKQRMATRYAHDTHHYCLHLDGGLVIDGHRMGGDGRFVNHSCQPNCEMQKWSVNGQFRMALFALRDITPDEELTYDYNFSLFNPAEGQVCKCGSENCRGVIGGKSQRVRQMTITSNSSIETNNNQIGRVGRPRKNQARRATTGPKEVSSAGTAQLPPGPVTVTPQIKPMSHQQKCFALQHHCFLLRNLDKVKRIKERAVSTTGRNQPQLTPMENSSVFLNQLNALRQPRNMRTRRLAQAEDNPELNKAARLASVLRDLFELVTTARDEKQSLLCASFLTLPSKRKHPEYFQRISNPIDLNTIEQNIATGVYRTVDAFDSDMIKLFVNSVRFFGRTSELGIAATRLRKIYGQGKMDCLAKLESVLGEKAPPNFVSGKDPGDEEEDVIRCICGLYRDEGLMIQCERCLVWQHCECVRADPAAASYHCERCVPREVDLEIPLDEYTEQGHRYYISLMRGNLQLRQGDTVYVLRDIPIPGTDKKHTYDTIGDVKYTDMDIFRIERLWKDSENGQRFAFGHHYLRPHETYHEPTRKFFSNEVMRVPLYEVVPVELIMSPCWVLDLNTYCKGRPMGAIEDHVYICEYRVDKTARLFSKISKSKYPICTKSYAFDRFDVRLKVSRTYTPHELNGAQVKPRGRRPHESEDTQNTQTTNNKEQVTPLAVTEQVPVIRSREEQRAHLNGILLRLLGRLPSKQALDVSYLLEGGRRRKKQQS